MELRRGYEESTNNQEGNKHKMSNEKPTGKVVYLMNDKPDTNKIAALAGVQPEELSTGNVTISRKEYVRIQEVAASCEDYLYAIEANVPNLQPYLENMVTSIYRLHNPDAQDEYTVLQ